MSRFKAFFISCFLAYITVILYILNTYNLTCEGRNSNQMHTAPQLSQILLAKDLRIFEYS